MIELSECKKCNTPLDILKANYCQMCGTLIKKPLEAYAKWQVTTEGDEEGKTVVDLGVHEGHIVDIAKELAHKAFYKLTFRQALIGVHKTKPPKSANISLDIDSNTWDLDKDELVVFFNNLLKDRSDVTVEPCNYYATVTLKFK